MAEFKCLRTTIFVLIEFEIHAILRKLFGIDLFSHGCNNSNNITSKGKLIKISDMKFSVPDHLSSSKVVL
jgi:hypothetical protein